MWPIYENVTHCYTNECETLCKHKNDAFECSSKFTKSDNETFRLIISYICSFCEAKVLFWMKDSFLQLGVHTVHTALRTMCKEGKKLWVIIKLYRKVYNIKALNIDQRTQSCHGEMNDINMVSSAQWHVSHHMVVIPYYTIFTCDCNLKHWLVLESCC